MRIEITTTFDDLTKPEDDQRVEAGAKLTVTADRGRELCDLGLAVEISPAADAQSSSTEADNTDK